MWSHLGPIGYWNTRDLSIRWEILEAVMIKEWLKGWQRKNANISVKDVRLQFNI